MVDMYKRFVETKRLHLRGRYTLVTVHHITFHTAVRPTDLREQQWIGFCNEKWAWLSLSRAVEPILSLLLWRQLRAVHGKGSVWPVTWLLAGPQQSNGDMEIKLAEQEDNTGCGKLTSFFVWVYSYKYRVRQPNFLFIWVYSYKYRVRQANFLFYMGIIFI
jgi:hypothetical protein